MASHGGCRLHFVTRLRECRQSSPRPGHRSPKRDGRSSGAGRLPLATIRAVPDRKCYVVSDRWSFGRKPRLGLAQSNRGHVAAVYSSFRGGLSPKLALAFLQPRRIASLWCAIRLRSRLANRAAQSERHLERIRTLLNQRWPPRLAAHPGRHRVRPGSHTPLRCRPRDPQFLEIFPCRSRLPRRPQPHLLPAHPHSDSSPAPTNPPLLPPPPRTT